MSLDQSIIHNIKKVAAPLFCVEQYFQGEINVSGIFRQRFSSKPKQFCANIICEGNAERLILNEMMTLEGSVEQRRVWNINKVASNTYEGRADDMVGIAKGVCRGNSIRWSYEMLLPYRNRLFRAKFDDQMFLLPTGMLLNIVSIRKLSFEVATLVAAYNKVSNNIETGKSG